MTDGSFYRDIDKFNEIYRLPRNDMPTMLELKRIRNFQNILAEEVEEGGDIADKYERIVAEKGRLSEQDRMEILTEMSDWLGDLVVYCTSEAKRWGIPLQEVLGVIMQSNFSKLDENGEPIYDERGKVMKGPGYWKPEPKIRQILERKS